MQPTEFRYRKVWLAIGFFLVLITVAGSLVPSLPETSVSLNDKFLHLFVYAVLGSWFGAFIGQRGKLLLALLALGLSMEFLQAVGGSRQAEVLDMIANVCGALLGVMVIGRFIGKPLLLAVDHKLASATNRIDTE